MENFIKIGKIEIIQLIVAVKNISYKIFFVKRRTDEKKMKG
jgi:hypothetical protein